MAFTSSDVAGRAWPDTQGASFGVHTVNGRGAHGGGALPYLVSRMDQCFDNIPACREKISRRPSEYIPAIYADAVVFSPGALALCVEAFGGDNVLYGSDYPHTIGDMPGCLARVDALPAVVRDKVRGRNAERIFNLS